MKCILNRFVNSATIVKLFDSFDELLSSLEITNCKLLGGLSLHSNNLIGSQVTNYNWQFGTLPFGIFWSNLTF